MANKVGDLFTVGNLEYKITSATKVEVVDYTVTGGAVTIPQTANHLGTNYDVTVIGNEALRNKQLTSVTMQPGEE